MNKQQQLNAERLLLEQFIKTRPEVKELLDNLINKDKNISLIEIVEPIIKERLKEARMIGIKIGWQAAFLRCRDELLKVNSLDEMKKYIKSETNKVFKDSEAPDGDISEDEDELEDEDENI